MKFLRIGGLALQRGIKKASNILTGCCTAFWQDARVWDDDCLWVETSEEFPYTFPVELD